MNKINLILPAIAAFCLLFWYILFVRNLLVSAVDLQLVTEEDTPLALHLRAKGFLQDDYQTEIVDGPQYGTLALSSQQAVYYPAKNFYGADRFTYRITTGARSSEPAEVSIQVTPVNDSPESVAADFRTKEDTRLKLVLQGSDQDGDLLQFQILKQPAHGRLSGSAPDLWYDPDANYSGSDRFTYRVLDGKSASKPAAINLFIDPINDRPMAQDQRLVVFQNTVAEFKFKGWDPDNEAVTFQVIEPPKNGNIEYRNGNPTYVPTKDFAGRDRILFSAIDGQWQSEAAIIEFEVKKIDRDVDLTKVLTAVLQKGGVAIGNYRKPEHLYHSGKYVPASVLKIVTAAAALHYLGANFRFKTEFYIDAERNLYIKGFGDPSLSSRDWHEIARTLQSRLLFDSDLKAMIIDTSVFANELNVDGRRHSIHYYDAPPSALASNYNTVSLRIKKDRRIQVIDEYTPLTSLVVKKAKRLPAGYQHFTVALDPNESVTYSAELAEEIFKEYGAFFNGRVLGGSVPDGISPTYVYRSHWTLKKVVKEMLRDSNNFIANQLLLALAYETGGEGGDIDAGAEIVSRFLQQEIGLNGEDFELIEGSGLSTKNNIDLLAMLKIVNYFYEFKELLPHLKTSKYPDLAETGRKWNILAKSGTLSNIGTLAGFIQVKNEEWKPFVIMLNDNRIKRGTVMDIIARYYNG